MNELIHTIRTPEELVKFSNQGHHVFGFIAILFSLTFLFEKSVKIRKIRSILFTMGGIYLLTLLSSAFFQEPSDKYPTIVSLIISDRQQSQHFLLAFLAIFGGFLEYIGQKRRNLLTLSLPTTLVTFGIILFIHPQHGFDTAVAWATGVHQILATASIAIGFLLALNRSLKKEWITMLVFFISLFAGLILLFYKEPQGAYHLL